MEERPHDYLYDPIYTLSSKEDHERSRRKAYGHSRKLEKLYCFENFFSDIPIHESFKWIRTQKDPVPPSVPREFNPSQLCRDLLNIQLKAAGGYDLDEDVRGKSRAKYFSYSRNPPHYCGTDDFVNVECALARLAQKQSLASTFRQPLDHQRTTVDRMVQTVYRDSEAQTDPYSPQYVVNVGDTPESLSLASLGMGKGLPAGLHDVEMIERARERRLVEKQLEPEADISKMPNKLVKRRKMLEDLELKEWHFREREVEALQDIRLKVLIKLLRKREEHLQEVAARTLDRIWREKSKENDAKRKAVQKKYAAALRKLARKRALAQDSSRKRDVIHDYATPSSQQFAPLTRLGRFPDRASENFAIQNHYLSSLEGLLELESCLDPKVLTPKISIKMPSMYTKDGHLRREYKHQKELAQLQKFLADEFMIKPKFSRHPRFLERIEKPPPRPNTPSCMEPSGELSMEMNIATIKLQRLIRGRAVQTEMYEAKEKRKELIAELQSTHALLEDDQIAQSRQKQSILDGQKLQADLIHQENQVDDVLAQMESASLADMLDFLSKELDRLLEERRIRARVVLAQRQRRMREAEESGNRQREERRRREQDEIFKQLVKVHQETVDGYLANIAGLSIDSTAARVAQSEMDDLAAEVDADAHRAELDRDELQSDLLAADLVHRFLIPEVSKRAFQASIDARQRKLLEAAHREIWGPANEAAEEKVRCRPRQDASTFISEISTKDESGENKDQEEADDENIN